MEQPHSLVAPQHLCRRARLSRTLAASVMCVFLVVLMCGYHPYASPSAPTSLLLRDGFPTDREIEFESAVAQRQGAKTTLKPVPAKVLSIFERAVNEQKHDLDAQPLEDGVIDSTLNMHRTAESKVMDLACKITTQSPACKQIAAAKAAALAKAASTAQAKKQAAAAAAQSKVIADAKAAAGAKAKLAAQQAKAISEAVAKAVAKATAAADAKLKAAAVEVAKAKREAAAAKADADARIKAAAKTAGAAASSKAKKK